MVNSILQETERAKEVEYLHGGEQFSLESGRGLLIQLQSSYKYTNVSQISRGSWFSDTTSSVLTSIGLGIIAAVPLHSCFAMLKLHRHT